MSHSSFAHFLKTLEESGELLRIKVPVATELQITELADREMKSAGGGKALLLEQPTIDGKVSKFPLAINTMGSCRRMAMALGRDSVDDLAKQL
ncbi:MAG: menaquinone biosynthesis decarboxylase, partial [Verrucomicrobia bacterium]|nr:menaquinone biosynthesis decarboxylase [Verrucomicrobiota bacterium]